jgi:hypothetical protein
MCGGGSLPLFMNVAAGRACLDKGKRTYSAQWGPPAGRQVTRQPWREGRVDSVWGTSLKR